MWRGDRHGNVRNGRFELHGLDPDAEVPVHFLDPQHKLGATARFSGKSAAGEPITVRLEPCGTATARLVNPDGKPLGGLTQPRLIWMVVTPGPLGGSKARKEGALIADYDPVTEVDPINYPKDPASDSQGRIVVPRPDPGRDLSHHRLLGLQYSGRPSAPQGVHRQARRGPRPGRYPDREAARFVASSRRDSFTYFIFSSFPRSAWECRPGRSASRRFPGRELGPDDAERRRRHSHAERGNEINPFAVFSL